MVVEAINTVERYLLIEKDLSHIVITPGSPSHFLPKNPPNEAIIRTASLRVGGVEGKLVVFFTKQYNAFHS